MTVRSDCFSVCHMTTKVLLLSWVILIWRTYSSPLEGRLVSHLISGVLLGYPALGITARKALAYSILSFPFWGEEAPAKR